jgi:hypothetical protein
MKWWGWISIWFFVWVGFSYTILSLFEKCNKARLEHFDSDTGNYFNEADIHVAKWIAFFITLLISAIVHGLIK